MWYLILMYTVCFAYPMLYLHESSHRLVIALTSTATEDEWRPYPGRNRDGVWSIGYVSYKGVLSDYWFGIAPLLLDSVVIFGGLLFSWHEAGVALVIVGVVDAGWHWRGAFFYVPGCDLYLWFKTKGRVAMRIAAVMMYVVLVGALLVAWTASR